MLPIAVGQESITIGIVMTTGNISSGSDSSSLPGWLRMHLHTCCHVQTDSMLQCVPDEVRNQELELSTPNDREEEEEESDGPMSADPAFSKWARA